MWRKPFESSGFLFRYSVYPIPNADTEDLSSYTVGLHCTGSWLADFNSASSVVRDALRNILDSEGSLKFKEESSKENDLLFRCSGYPIPNADAEDL
jgi:hypothetical protein